MEHDEICFFVDIYDGNYSIYWPTEVSAEEFYEFISSFNALNSSSEIKYLPKDDEWQSNELRNKPDFTSRKMQFFGVKSDMFESSWEHDPYSHTSSNEISFRFGEKHNLFDIRKTVMDSFSETSTASITTAALVNHANVLWFLLKNDNFENIIKNNEFNCERTGKYGTRLDKRDLFRSTSMVELLKPLFNQDDG
jgi:hypothetical protein